MSKETKTTKKDLPEILETECEDKDAITLLLEKGLALKSKIGVAPDEKKGVVGSGLLKEYHEVKEELGVFQKLHGFDGLRHNQIAYTVSHREGRETVDMKALVEGLVGCGVDPTVVRQCIENATKVGAGYYVREIVDLAAAKKPSGKKGEWD